MGYNIITMDADHLLSQNFPSIQIKIQLDIKHY